MDTIVSLSSGDATVQALKDTDLMSLLNVVEVIVQT